MKIVGCRRIGCLLAACLLAGGFVVSAPSYAVEPPHVLEPPELPGQDGALEGDVSAAKREAVLNSLYQRLERAETPERAKAVAKSIERVWRNSGSATIDLLLARAMLLASEEKYNPALAILDSVVIADPDFAEGWSQRAMIHFQKRDFQAALRDLRRVLALEPKHFRAMQGLAVILGEFGDKEGALAAYRRVLDVYPLKKEARDALNQLVREVEGEEI